MRISYIPPSNVAYSVAQFVADLFRLVQPYKARFLLGALLRLSSDLVNLYPTYALSRMVVLLTNIESGSVEAKTQEAIWLLVGWAAAVIYHSLAHDTAKWLGYQVSERVALDTRLQAFRHIFSLDIAWQEKEKIGNKIKRIDHGSKALDGTIRIFFNVIIEACLNAVSIFLIFLALDLHLALTMFVFMVAYFIFSALLTKRAARQAYIVNQHQEDLEGISYEALNNIKTVKSLSIHQALLGTLGAYTNQTYAAIQKRVTLFQFRNGFLGLFYYLFEIGMISYIVWQILQGELSAAILILFVGYFSKVEEAVFELAEVSHELVINKLQFYRLKEILLTRPTIEGGHLSQQQAMPDNWKQIELKNVTFSYGQKKVLNNFNLIIERGQKIGIVGLSGAGKSTLFNLLLDLYENYEGEILVDDIPLTHIRRQDYINHLAVVLQDTELFNLSLKENILIGAQPEAKPNDARVMDVISRAHLSEVIERLPDGVDTIIGEKGVKLSGGEKQRLGIARALYRQPDLLLMDEATSHLDVDSEKKIQASLHQFFKKVTAVVIAHRLSTIKEMDTIVVMHGGKIIESGSFEQLIRQNGAFARLWEKQRL